MKHLPLHHDFNGRRCLIVGGGAVACRRARRVLDAGGTVDVVALDATDDLKKLVTDAGGTLTMRAYRAGDVGGDYALVVAATDDRAVNRQVADAARAKNIPLNVADDAAAGDVVFPLTINRDPLTITVTSGAASPTLTRLLGERIDALLPDGYGALAGIVGKHRARVKKKIPDAKTRTRFWENILQGAVAEAVFSGKVSEAEKLLEQSLATGGDDSGEVYLIGAGPGDPDLLTLRAFRLLQQADVVLYDRLVSPEILSRLSAGAEQVYVGKDIGDTDRQKTINRLLIDHAREGKRVARLKGGDPFIFGRGGEEIAELAGEGIAFQVIPGVTAANGCASYAGIPLTHRDHAQSVCFVAGQLRDGGVDLDWSSLAAPGQTLVFYMSLKGLPVICKNLCAAGVDATMPVALIEKGTTLQQKVYVSTLGEMQNVIDKNKIHAPTIFIVGTVVSLHQSLRWFNARN